MRGDRAGPEVHGDGQLARITIQQTKTKADIVLECDAVLCALGFVSDLGEVKKWGIELDGNGIKVDTATQELKLIACGTSEAAIAVNQAMNYMDPTQKVQPVHSSNLTLPISAKVGAQP